MRKLLFLFVLPCMAETTVSDRFYDAIRRDDTAAVQSLLKSNDVNLKDSRGDTPLMYASAVGSEAMMRLLIDGGADVNTKNSFEATPLMWAITSLPRVKMLVEHGADVKARSKAGHTPVLLACFSAGNLDVVKLLLSKGATLNIPPDSKGLTPLAAATSTNDPALIKFVIEKGGPGALAGPAGPMSLINAASFGNLEMVKFLLSKGVDANSQTPPNLGLNVKNGPILIGSLTPLVLAASSGSVETVQALLDAGAKVDLPDVRGMTPLMLAVATQHPNLDIIRLLLARRADTSIKSKAGETAIDWAVKYQHPQVLALFKTAPRAPEKSALPAAGARDLRTSVEKSVALMQAAGATNFREGGCVSCHGGNVVTQTTSMARRKGLHIDASAAAETARATQLQFAANADAILERSDLPAIEIMTFALVAMSEEGIQPDRITDSMVVNIAAQQLLDGNWPYRGIMRPPTADNFFTNAAYCIRAFRDFAPPARRREFDQKIARAAQALRSGEPSTTEDRVAQLLGLKWAGEKDLARYQKGLLALQRTDGGWGQTPHLVSDAYATGTALYALHEAGTQSDSAVYRNGVSYLLKTQAADGSWHVVSHSPKFQPYFEGGFPYGHDQWISQWGTGWAAIALAQAIK